MTDAEYQQLIIDECNASEYEGVLSAVRNYWSMYSGKTSQERFYLTKIRLLNFMLGKLRKKKDLVIGKDQAKLNQEFTNVRAMLAETQADMTREFPNTNVPTLNTVEVTDGLPDTVSRYVERIEDGYYIR